MITATLLMIIFSFVLIIYTTNVEAAVTNNCVLQEFHPTDGTDDEEGPATKGYCQNITSTGSVGNCNSTGTYIESASSNGRFKYQAFTNLAEPAIDYNISYTWYANVSNIESNFNYIWWWNVEDDFDTGQNRWYFGTTSTSNHVLSTPQTNSDCLNIGSAATSTDGTFHSYSLRISNNNSLAFYFDGVQVGFTDDMSCGQTDPARNLNTSLRFMMGTPDSLAQTFGTKNVTFLNESCTLDVTVDTTTPHLNISINDSVVSQNDVINISANISDETELSFCQIIWNQTNSRTEFYNFTASGTQDECSQNFTITVTSGNVINFTILVNDSSNNKNQSSTIHTTGDVTSPTIDNMSLAHIFMNFTDTNRFSAYCRDTESFLDIMNFTLRYNQTTINLTRENLFTTGSSCPPNSFCIQGEISLDTKSYIWNYTIFSSEETAKEGYWNITDVGCADRAENYKSNDSTNNFVGFDFLMDTLPVINSRSVANDSTVGSIDTIANLVITETNPSFMLLYHNITGIYHLNQTINYSGDGTTQNVFNLSDMTDGKTYIYSTSINTSFGSWANSTNFTFTISVGSGSGATATGAGGTSFIDRPKPRCKIEFIPNEIRLSPSDDIKQVFIRNTEAFSISPTFEFTESQLIQIKGDLSKVIPSQERQELILVSNQTRALSLLAINDLANATLSTSLIVKSHECKDVILPIFVSTEIDIPEPIKQIQTALFDSLGVVNLGFVKFHFRFVYIITLISILTLIMIFSVESLRTLTLPVQSALFAIIVILLSSLVRVFIDLLLT